METKAKHFARVVLGVHLLLLVGIITGVFFASKEVYQQTRQQSLRQAAHSQELLTAQTADGIEGFYNSIQNNLDLIHRANAEDGSGAAATQPTAHAFGGTLGFGPMPFPIIFRTTPEADARNSNRFGDVIGRLLWRQLEGRASLLFAIDARETPPNGRPRPLNAIGPPNSDVEAHKVVEQMLPFLQRVDQPSVSEFREIPDVGNGNVLCVPTPPARPGGKEHRLLVAFIPIKAIQDQFLSKLNPADSTTAATLIDEKLVTMVSSDPKLVGMNARQIEDKKIVDLAGMAGNSDKPVTVFLEQPYQVVGVTRQPRMVSMVPVDVLGKRWFLMVSSRLETVDGVVNGLFRHALYWAIFVVVAMTGILVSTSVWLIRGRVRLERVRHEMLTRELTQAREIQKAWLPQKKLSGPLVDVAAVNQPANHISGDFYDWFELPDSRLVVTIGDVTGHGMSAAFLMATTQLLVRTTITRVLDPGRCLVEVNRQLCTQIFVGQFVTMLIAVLDLKNGELHVATAGHYPPLLGDGSTFTSLDMEPELVLGVDPASEYRTETFDLPAGASLLMYTDGVLDVLGPNNKRFGKEGLRQSLTGSFDGAQAIVDHLMADVDRFRDRRELPDDLTFVAVQLATTAAGREMAVTMTH